MKSKILELKHIKPKYHVRHGMLPGYYKATVLVDNGGELFICECQSNSKEFLLDTLREDMGCINLI